MPRKTMLQEVSMRTVLNLRPNERAALNALVQAAGDFPARVVGTLALRAWQALQAGATWDEVLTALAAPAEAPGGSPTAEPSESVAGDVTDRLTDRPQE